MFKYKVRLTLYSGKTVEGVAKTTSLSTYRQEILQVVGADNEPLDVITDDIKSIDVLTANARFSHIDFA